MIEEKIESYDSSSRRNFLKTEIKLENNYIKDEEILSAKFHDMKKSAFSFFRGTAHLFYSDLNSERILIPTDWKETPKINTWILGDFHSQNIGFFENSEAKIKLDVNDFDESYIAPFYLDLIRFVVSIFLQRDSVEFNLDMKEANQLSEYFLREYQETLGEISEEGKELELIKNNLDGFPKNTLEELKDEKSNKTLLDKWTNLIDEKRKFDFSNPDLIKLSEVELQEFHSNWNEYLESLGDFSDEKGYSYFEIQDIARRLNSGTGGQGVYKYYVLIRGNKDQILLEAKEKRLPALFRMNNFSEVEYLALFTSHAVRSMTASKAMLANPDNFLGTMTAGNRSYLVSKISPFKKKLEPKDFHSEADFKKFLKHSAKAIAYAHSRSYKSILIKSTSISFANTALAAIKQWPSTRNSMIEIASSYSEQVKLDYQYFKDWLDED